MRLLHLNVVYPHGSTGKLVKSIHENLIDDGHESIVIYGRGKSEGFAEAIKNAPEPLIKMQSLKSKLSGIAYGGAVLSTLILKRRIIKLKPDIVHIHVINANMVNIYELLRFLRKRKISTVLTLHAEYMYTAGCSHSLECNKWKTGCYKCPQKGSGRPSSKFFDRSKKEWKLMKKSLLGFEGLQVTCVSDWLYNRAKQSPFFQNVEMSVVLNGVDETMFYPRPIVPKIMLNDMGFKIIHITSGYNHYLKGTQHVLDIAEKLSDKNITFYIIGVNEIPNQEYSNVKFIKPIYDQDELARFYSSADLLLLTSLVETFSMVTAESLLCGTPVVGYKAGGPESIALSEYSEFVDYGEQNDLIQVINSFLDTPVDSEVISNEAKVRYSSRRMYSEFMQIYKKVVR